MDTKTLTVDFFRPDDAEGVAKLFTEVYGDGYPAKIVYDPRGLIGACERRDNIPIAVLGPIGKGSISFLSVRKTYWSSSRPIGINSIKIINWS